MLVGDADSEAASRVGDCEGDTELGVAACETDAEPLWLRLGVDRLLNDCVWLELGVCDSDGNATVRIMLLPLSATSPSPPTLSTDSRHGLLKLARAPCPSARPDVVEPARVVTRRVATTKYRRQLLNVSAMNAASPAADRAMPRKPALKSACVPMPSAYPPTVEQAPARVEMR